jgi:hypothetical protein
MATKDRPNGSAAQDTPGRFDKISTAKVRHESSSATVQLLSQNMPSCSTHCDLPELYHQRRGKEIIVSIDDGRELDKTAGKR